MNHDAERLVDTVGKSLRSFGVPRAVVDALQEDLRLEVAAAIRAGESPASIVGSDIRRFAADLATAEGFEPLPSRLLGLSIATAAPPSLIAFLVYVVVAGGGPALGLPEMRASVDRNSSNERFVEVVGEGWFVAATYGLAAILGFALALSAGAAYLAVRRDTRVGRTVRNMALAMPLGGIAGVPGAMLVGAATHYSDDAQVIAIECGIVTVASLSALWAARRLARGLPLRLALASHMRP